MKLLQGKLWTVWDLLTAFPSLDVWTRRFRSLLTDRPFRTDLGLRGSKYMEYWSPDLSLDSGYRQGDKAPEGTCIERTSTVQRPQDGTMRWSPSSWHAVLMPLPQPPPSPSSVFPFPLQSLSSGGSHEGLVKTQLAGLHPLTSLFLGLTGIHVRLVMGAHSENHCSRQSWKLRTTWGPSLKWIRMCAPWGQGPRLTALCTKRLALKLSCDYGTEMAWEVSSRWVVKRLGEDCQEGEGPRWVGSPQSSPQTIVLSPPKISDKYLKFHKSSSRKKPTATSCLILGNRINRSLKLRVLGSLPSCRDIRC